MMKCVKGDLASAMPKFNNNQTAVTVVAASGGYPGSYKKGLKISGISEAQVLTFVDLILLFCCLTVMS